MDLSKNILDNSNFHFIGIGGISMSALAKYLLSEGKIVSGSDLSSGRTVIELKNLGAKIYQTHHKENIGNAQVVVYTSAISDDNPELVCAKKNGLALVKRSQLLALISDKFPRSIGIAGSHGKTTATAMLSRILVKAGISPTCFIGGIDNALGNFLKGSGGACVYEACEYKYNFLDLSPSVSVVLNVDMDHADCYLSQDDIIRAFKEYSGKGLSIINADDENSNCLINEKTVTFGIENTADYMATDLNCKNGRYSFSVKSNKKLGKINLKVMGKHNVYNALSAIAVADMLKVKFSCIKTALNSFDGVGRRMESIGRIFGAKAYADYAHHPKEITETLKSFGNGVVVFQPHTYSRTKFFMDEFVSCLSKYEKVIIYRAYPAREKFDENGSAKTLYKNLKTRTKNLCFYADTPNDLKMLLGSIVKVDDNIIFLGAGDIYEMANEIVD